MKQNYSLVLLICVLMIVVIGSLQQDKGEAIVDEALKTLDGLDWLNENSHLFMKRIALCESNYGKDPNTYRRYVHQPLQFVETNTMVLGIIMEVSGKWTGLPSKTAKTIPLIPLLLPSLNN